MEQNHLCVVLNVFGACFCYWFQCSRHSFRIKKERKKSALCKNTMYSKIPCGGVGGSRASTNLLMIPIQDECGGGELSEGPAPLGKWFLFHQNKPLTEWSYDFNALTV